VRLLLDTATAIWALESPERLSTRAAARAHRRPALRDSLPVARTSVSEVRGSDEVEERTFRLRPRLTLHSYIELSGLSFRGVPRPRDDEESQQSVVSERDSSPSADGSE
jgi:hypothetical protein